MGQQRLLCYYARSQNSVEYLTINLTHNLPGRMTRGCILRLIWKYIAYPVSTGSEISGKWFYLFVSLSPHLLHKKSWSLHDRDAVRNWNDSSEVLDTKWVLEMNWCLSLWVSSEKKLLVRNTWCSLITNQPSLDDVIPHSPTLSVSVCLSHTHTHTQSVQFIQAEREKQQLTNYSL